jgi:hypothetical protein
VDEIKETPKRFSKPPWRRIGGIDDGVLKDLLDAQARERGALGKQTFVGSPEHYGDERLHRIAVGPKNRKACLQCENETRPPFAGRHTGCLNGILRRQSLVQRENYCALARVIAVQKANADSGLLGDIPKRGRLISSLPNHFHRRLEKPLTCGFALSGSPRGPAPFA